MTQYKIFLLLGFGAVYNISSDLAYLGMFIVRKDLRRQGIGAKLWSAMMASAGERNVCLDGAKAMVPWYTKQGFVHHGHRVVLHTVRVTQAMKLGGAHAAIKVASLGNGMWPMLLDYDRKVYRNLDRNCRERILRACLGDADVKAVMATNVTGVVGYGSIHRKENDAYGIRYVYADDADVVDALLRTLLVDVSEGSLLYFWPVVGKDVLERLRGGDLKTYETGLRMYTKAKLDIDENYAWLVSAHLP